MSKKIRKGDRVVVIAGNDKGKAGQVLMRSGERVLVQGVNIRKKHLKRTQETPQGRIVEMEVPVHISNVCICDKENKPMRLQVAKDQNGERSLISRDGSKETVYRRMKKPA